LINKVMAMFFRPMTSVKSKLVSSLGLMMIDDPGATTYSRSRCVKRQTPAICK